MIHDLQEPTGSAVPDVLVALDREQRDRSSYKFSVEGKPPEFVLEVISPTSKTRNRIAKKRLYAELGIKEYFVFQPETTSEEPRLVGYRLSGKEYVELSPDPTAGPGGALRSEVLGVSLRPDQNRLRLRSLATGEDYHWLSESAERSAATTKELSAAEERARREAKRRRAAEETARREAKRRRAAEETARRAAAKQQAAEESARREAKERRAALETARRAAKERRAALETARRAAAKQQAAEESARRAATKQQAAEESARRAATKQQAAEESAAAADERARRTAQERDAAKVTAAAGAEKAATAEARAAKLEALLAAARRQLRQNN